MNVFPEAFLNFAKLTHAPIDIHSHFNHGSPFDCPEAEVHLRSLEFQRSVYQKAGIKSVGFSTYASVLKHCECIFEENEYSLVPNQYNADKGFMKGISISGISTKASPVLYLLVE